MVNPEVENSKELDSGEREIFFYRNASEELRHAGRKGPQEQEPKSGRVGSLMYLLKLAASASRDEAMLKV